MKRITLILFIVFFDCCSAQVKKNDLKSLKLTPSHVTNNEVLKSTVISFINKEMKKKSPLNIILLKVNDVSGFDNQLLLKSSNFNYEKQMYQLNDFKDKPKGYVNIGGYLVLLYGDTELYFKELFPPSDILGNGQLSSVMISIHTSSYLYKYDTKKKLFEFIEILDDK